MDYKRILTIQDISCVGQCSLTVALPIISACGSECAVLPSAVLSTHTGGFSGFTFRDLTEDIPAIKNHWLKEGLLFDSIYTGYLGSTKQIEYIKDIFAEVAKENAEIFVDPAMADNGNLYYGFDMEYVKSMASLCTKADYTIPNLTEACFMTGIEYKESYDRQYIQSVLDALTNIGCKNIILTGISYQTGRLGVVVFEDGNYSYYEHEKLPNSCHGTGDIYASAFVGAKALGKTAYESAKIAADFTLECIRYTSKLENHTYGAAFEPVLHKLIKAL